MINTFCNDDPAAHISLIITFLPALSLSPRCPALSPPLSPTVPPAAVCFRKHPSEGVQTAQFGIVVIFLFVEVAQATRDRIRNRINSLTIVFLAVCYHYKAAADSKMQY